jgi:DNA ligase D-like protein (predicted ligase)
MKYVEPMLARSADPFSDTRWIFEIKWDGTRALCYIEDTVHLINRRQIDITHRYPEFQAIHEHVQAHSCVLDGEIVVLRDGIPSFRDLQRREHNQDSFKISLLTHSIPAQFIVFDILSVNGEDVTGEPLLDRKQLLHSIVTQTSQIIVSPFIEGEGESYFISAVKRGFEGIMAKKKDSVYQPGVRSGSWLKIKKTHTVDCVIGGYTEGEGAREQTFGALLLGVNDPLDYIGKVGTGFTDADLAYIHGLLSPLETDDSPFSTEIDIEGVHYVQPVYVCEVKYLERTHDNRLRAPVFLRLRSDKDPDDCILDDEG